MRDFDRRLLLSSGEMPRRYGLYHPYFHIRNSAWLKVAALYWPRIVRIVPDGYEPRDSSDVRQLIVEADFIRTMPPGSSVEAASQTFLELLDGHGHWMRERFASETRLGELEADLSRLNPEQFVYSAADDFQSTSVLGPSSSMSQPRSTEYQSKFAVIHRNQMTPELANVLITERLADIARFAPHARLSVIGDDMFPVVDPDRTNWLVADRRLVSAYSTVFADDFARANHLTPTTDQLDAFSLTGDWSADALIDVLAGPDQRPKAQTHGQDFASCLGFLALELVVPKDLGSVPIDRIIEIRSRYGKEFNAFGCLVDHTAAALSEGLPQIRDRAQLDSYINDAVTHTFLRPLDELKAALRSLGIDATTLSINVRTELPAGLVLAGGTWLAGHPMVAGAAGVGIGILGIGRNLRKERRHAMTNDPAMSYLLHLERQLTPGDLLRRTVGALRRRAVS